MRPRNVIRLRAGMVCFCLVAAGTCVYAAGTDARQAYNRGVELYKQGEYTQAAEAFQRALDTANPRTEAWTNYNLGTIRVEQAQAAAGINQLKEALLLYRRALTIDPRDEDAKYNYELTLQRLQEWEQSAPQQSSAGEGEDQQQPEAAKDDSPEEGPAPRGERDETDEVQPPPSPAVGAQMPEQPEAESQAAAAPSPEEESRSMTPQEALMLLDTFHRQEQSRQQPLQPERSRQEVPVEKDW